MTNKLFMKEPVTPRLLLIDGLSRAGKMLAGKLISNFQRVEYFLPDEAVDHIGILRQLSVIDDDNAVSFLRLHLDVAIYNQAVGRNLNLRNDDSSSVHLALNYDEYAKRALESDIDDVMDRFNEEGRFPLFMTHEMLPNIDLFFAAVEDLHVIEMVRHPIDLAFSWHRRGWGERWGIDPLALTPALKHGDAPVPWFAAEFADDYLALSPMDRVIRSILAMGDYGATHYEKLSSEHQARIHFLPYEGLMTAPSVEIDKLAAFMGIEPLDGMPRIIAREGLPTGPLTESVREKLSFVKKNAAPELFESLLTAAGKYEAEWGLEPLVP